MDLIGTLVEQLGINRTAAEGAAGSVLAAIKQAAPAEEAQEVTDKIPEAQSWIATAAHAGGSSGAPPGGGGAGGGILEMAGGLLGGLGGGGVAGGASALGSLTSTLSQLGIGGDKLGTIVPLVIQFLQSRLGDGTFGKIMSAVPFLKQFAGGDAGGSGLGGLVGGLLKR